MSQEIGESRFTPFGVYLHNLIRFTFILWLLSAWDDDSRVKHDGRIRIRMRVKIYKIEQVVRVDGTEAYVLGKEEERLLQT